jgi:hypothetical protein
VRACVAPASVTVTEQLRAAIDQVEAALGPLDSS